jgi:hypothetical protein
MKNIIKNWFMSRGPYEIKLRVKQPSGLISSMYDRRWRMPKVGDTAGYGDRMIILDVIELNPDSISKEDVKEILYGYYRFYKEKALKPVRILGRLLMRLGAFLANEILGDL